MIEAFIIAWVVHELGHIMAWLSQGVMPKGVVLSFYRPVLGLGIMFGDDKSSFTAQQRRWGTTGGLVASLVFGLLVLPSDWKLGVISLLTFAVNLLPFKGSDGYKLKQYRKEHNAEAAQASD